MLGGVGCWGVEVGGLWGVSGGVRGVVDWGRGDRWQLAAGRSGRMWAGGLGGGRSLYNHRHAARQQWMSYARFLL